MKNHFVLVFIIAVLSVSLFAGKYDIRRLKWGMSIEEVQEVEGLGSNLYKGEELSGIQIEVLFGCDKQGLYSVTYHARTQEFADIADNRLRDKYGTPKTELDYSFLMKSRHILKRYPTAVVAIMVDGDYSALDNIKSTGSGISERNIIKNGLTKRKMWEYGNTVVLLLISPEGAALSYWSKAYHYTSKEKFKALVEELKKRAKKTGKNKSEKVDKF